MIGSVENGFMAEVKIGRMVVPNAGVRVREGFAEVAYLGRAPTRVPFDLTVGDRETKATAMRKSDVKGMVVLIVDWADG